MGKAEIISGGSGGSYSIQVLYDKTTINKNIGLINDAITKAETLIVELETELVQKQTEYDDAQIALDQQIDDFSAAWSLYYAEKIAYINSLDPAEVEPDERPLEPDDSVIGWDELQQALIDQRWAQSEVQRVESSLNYQKLSKASLDLRLTQLQAVLTDLDDDIRSVWCADLSTTLAGTVDTLEIDGEPEHVIIYPPAAGLSSHGGMLAPIMGMTAAQAAFNFAIHPGWQRWMPTYRTATITTINYDADTASVELTEAESHYQNLPINNHDALSDIPVKYMNCDAMPFFEGDSVVVEMSGQNWSNPVVIGYVANPKPCCLPYARAILETGTEIGGWFYPKTIDLTPYQGNGTVVYPHKYPRWRLVFADYTMGETDDSKCHCYQFSRGRVNSHGRLVDLTDSILVPDWWYPFSTYYPRYMELQIGCRPHADSHGFYYFWSMPIFYGTATCRCHDIPNEGCWWVDLPEEERYWYWMEDDEWYSDL